MYYSVVDEYRELLRHYRSEPCVWLAIQRLDIVPSAACMRAYLETEYGIEMSLNKVKATYKDLEDQGYILQTNMNPMYRMNRDKLHLEYVPFSQQEIEYD